MKKLSFVSILLLITLTAIFCTVPANNTVVYVVRHAEKVVTDPRDENPGLNSEGKQRANDLANELKHEKFGVVFSTNYKRTRQTAAPVAQQLGLPIATYNASDFDGLAKTIHSNYAGQKILIIGHSNTVPQLIKALGAEPPIKKLTDNDYDLLFKITAAPGGKATVEAMRYGKAHHDTELP